MSSDSSNTHGNDCGGCPLQDAQEQAPIAGLSRRDFVSASMLTAIAVTLSACGGGDLSAADRILAASSTPTTPATTPVTPTTPTKPTTPTTPAASNPTVGANQVGVTVASYAALASIGGVAVVNANPPFALARASTGFVAYSLRCPHQGTTVNIVGTTSWRCPNHDALFASTGAWTGGQRSAALIARTVTPNAAGTFVVVNLT